MRKSLMIVGVLFFLNVLAWTAVYSLSQPFLEVTFFDVGQGDAIFIETPSGHQILIDGGPGSAILEKLGNEMPFWDRTIDLVILTHPERDHYGGLLEVLKRYKVENILWTGILRDTAEYQEWQRLIERSNVLIAESGQQIIAGEAVFKILFPFDSLQGEEVKNTNNTSIVSKLICGSNSFLFVGDIYKKIERELIGKGIDSDVLKIAHHGSKTSSAQEFIEAVSPNIAVIQVGKENSYGHPTKEVLDILEKHGINILRTDLNGDIKILCNFQSLKLK